MADRRSPMLPPSRPISRAHTPQPSLLSQYSDPADQSRPRLSFSSTLSSRPSLPDLKKPSVKRPKFVARASYYLTGHGKPKEPDYFKDIELKQEQQPVPLEQLINSLQNELMLDPLKSLGRDRNDALLRVLEGYMTLQAERDLLLSQLHEIIHRHDRNVDMLEEERKEWKQDEEVFRAEIKRLEIFIAEGKTGLSQVALARQHTLIRPKGQGRPRGHSDKSDAAKSTVSTMSSKSVKEIKINVRPTTPSQDMASLSKDMKTHKSFLSFDFLSSRPPSRLKGVSLADVDIPKHWRKKSEAPSAAPSITSSPAKSFTSDFSSNGGDLLEDELQQQDLVTQAIEHVAKLMAARGGSDPEANVFLLREQIAGSSIASTYGAPHTRPRGLTLSSHSSGEMPTIRRPAPKTLTQRRGNDAMSIKTENTRPWTAVGSSGHGRRPFSFQAGDDDNVMTNLRTAPPNLASSHAPSDSSHTSPSSLDMPLKRHSSLIPGPVPEHVLARPRREDSASSVITSFQGSPIGDGRPFSTISSQAGGSNSSASASRPTSSSLIRTTSMSVLGDRTNSYDKALPMTPRIGSSSNTSRPNSVRSQMTALRGQASVQSLVQDLEMKGSASDSVDKVKKGKKDKDKDAKKKSPKVGRKDKSGGKKDSA